MLFRSPPLAALPTTTAATDFIAQPRHYHVLKQRDLTPAFLFVLHIDLTYGLDNQQSSLIICPPCCIHFCASCPHRTSVLPLWLEGVSCSFVPVQVLNKHLNALIAFCIHRPFLHASSCCTLEYPIIAIPASVFSPSGRSDVHPILEPQYPLARCIANMLNLHWKGVYHRLFRFPKPKQPVPSTLRVIASLFPCMLSLLLAPFSCTIL